MKRTPPPANPRRRERPVERSPRPWHALIPTTFAVPAVPQSTSPVPALTSLHGAEGRGPYGRSDYPGNCSGLLIEDLLRYFQPRSVMDPMTGGGTCGDVCYRLGIPCHSLDLKSGFDAADPQAYRSLDPVDFVWLHPPYWSLIRYSDDPRCLSNAPTLAEFLARLRRVLANCRAKLAPHGRLAVLMGDMRRQGEYCGLPFHTFNVAVAEGFTLAAPDIIRFSHGTTSSGKSYPFPLIPRLHETCLVLKQRAADASGVRSPSAA